MKHFKKVSLMLAVLCMWVGCVMDQIQESIVQRISIFMIGAERIQIILYMLQVHKKQRL